MDKDIKFSQHNKETLDPSSLKFEVKNTTIGMLVDMLADDMIDIQPEFQGKGGLWSRKDKCELIESVALGLPLPSFYFYIDSKRKKWIVIDGLQRLGTFKEFFVVGDLTLSELKFVKDLNGKSIKNMDFFDVTNMKMFPVTLNILTGKISSYVISQIFKRVNSQGTQLTPAEIRNAIFHGNSTKLISMMIAQPFFKELVSKNINTDRMVDREYVTRYLAFLLGNFESYAGNMDSFLCDAMECVNRLPENQIIVINRTFANALSYCNTLFGTDAFRIPQSKYGERKHPISRAVFEMLTVSFSNLSHENFSKIERVKQFFLNDYEMMFAEKQMKATFSSNMDSVSNVTYRFDKITTLILKYIK